MCSDDTDPALVRSWKCKERSIKHFRCDMRQKFWFILAPACLDPQWLLLSPLGPSDSGLDRSVALCVSERLARVINRGFVQASATLLGTWSASLNLLSLVNRGLAASSRGLCQLPPAGRLQARHSWDCVAFATVNSSHMMAGRASDPTLRPDTAHKTLP